ncbi:MULTISPECIES: pyridoxamine 5'-phosphate oxidase family protein [unclassified Streptomyces]|uniref:pyridoxamine 5'-phosphate oxidase family protein n=1 Tax=unclassified Streptomyces TaxID=2593676 RepID=UPI000DAE4FCB|nr:MULTISPECIES: pyridoxamine 5'-phosphate oxidase family protein [unclassified Streptomyces]PZT71729.1 pyridoxamine 5'-phosphate oxidase family protein [Streptomyces sp. AC1-42T]PZT73145.1 pyridoxamine 5'-phosphate oxidase family protein [Streptomyces sp. AC1-42W]
MTEVVSEFSEIEGTFLDYVREIKYATMVTVDREQRPRARVLLPVWEIVDGVPVGWLASYRTPVKSAHLANNPHTTYAYWSPRQNAVFVDSVSTWADDEESKLHAWRLYQRGGPPGVGYDPVRYWRGGPGDPGYHVLRIDPWRIQLVRGADLHGTLWRRREPDPAGAAGTGPAARAA